MIYARAMLAYLFPGLLAGFYGGHGGGLSRLVPYWALGAELTANNRKINTMNAKTLEAITRPGETGK